MKYLIYNDLEYLIRKRKRLLLLLILIPLGNIFINSAANGDSLDIIIYSLGLSINFENLGALELIMYLFNVSLFIFLVADLYIKDVAYQLDNIFLRTRPAKWFVKKTILFMICVLFMKLIEYLGIFIFFVILKNVNIINQDFIKIFFCDYLYILLIQYLFLLIYIISIYLSKHKWVCLLLFVVAMIFIPKNIFSLRNDLLIILGAIVGVQIIIYLMFRISSKKIIESV